MPRTRATRRPRLTAGPWSSRRRGLIAVLLVAFSAFVLSPGHAAARCFGVPEPTPIGAGWYVNLTVTARDGQRDTARFGAAVGATNELDTQVEVFEDLASNRTLLLFFVIKDSRIFERTLFVSVDVSVNPADPGITVWPLTIEHRGEDVQDFRLSWNGSETAQVPSSWSLIMKPFGVGGIDMRTQDEVELRLGPGRNQSLIVGTNAPADSPASLSTETLLASLVLYTVIVAAVILLRARRRRRRGDSGKLVP